MEVRRANGTIVCGVGASDDSRAVAQVANAIAERLGLRLVLTQAVDLPARVFGRPHLRQLREEAERSLQLTDEQLGRTDSFEIRVEFGDAARLLARVAAEEDADLIVLGSRTPPPTVPRSRLRLAQREPTFAAA